MTAASEPRESVLIPFYAAGAGPLLRTVRHRKEMNARIQRRLNMTLALMFMLGALAIALLVGLQGRQEGKGWLVCILFGATAGVLGSYCGLLVSWRFLLGCVEFRNVWREGDPDAQQSD